MTFHLLPSHSRIHELIFTERKGHTDHFRVQHFQIYLVLYFIIAHILNLMSFWVATIIHWIIDESSGTVWILWLVLGCIIIWRLAISVIALNLFLGYRILFRCLEIIFLGLFYNLLYLEYLPIAYIMLGLLITEIKWRLVRHICNFYVQVIIIWIIMLTIFL